MQSFPRVPWSGAALLRACSLLLLALSLFTAAAPAHAGVDDAFTQIRAYEDAMVERITDVVESDEVNRIANTFFLVMALALFVLKCTAYALRGFDLADMFQTMMQIMITAFLMASFTVIVPAIFNAALYVGQALLAGLGGISFNSNEARDLPSSLVGMLVKYGGTIGPECDVDWYNPFSALDCIKNGVISVIATLIMVFIIGLLCIAVTLVDIWGFWLYSIAFALGKLLLPFTLYRRLSFLFDGWLRFFFGALIYLILAQVNVALVAVAILTFLGTTVQAVASNSFTAPAQPPIKDLADILGMVLFCGVGIFTLFATGRFAGAIVAGAGAGGLNFAKIAQSVVRIVAAPVMIASTGVKGAVQGVKDKKASLAAQQRDERAARRAASGGNSRPRPSNVPARNRPPPPAPSLSFGQFIGAAAGGMARAYRDAGLRNMMRNHSFRRGYNFVKGGNSSGGGNRGSSRDRHNQAHLDNDRWMQDNASRSGAGT